MLLDKNKINFIELCDELLGVLGKKHDVVILGKESKGTLYEDDVIYVATSENGQDIEVMRKSNLNPVIYTQDASALRFDKEYIYLIDHITALIKKNT